MPTKKTCFKDSTEFSEVHPLALHVPAWRKDDPRFLALAADVRERGMDQRILIDQLGRVVDGKNLANVARKLELAEVECAIVPDEEIAGTILGNLMHRRHLTKGQRAYIAFPVLEPAFQEASRRRRQNLIKNPTDSPLSGLSGKTVEDFAEYIGIGRSLFFQAAQVHRLMANNKKFEWNDERKPLTLREYYEPRILDEDDPAGLGAVIAGIGAKLSDKTENQSRSGQLELFTHAFGTLKTRFGYWKKFTREQKDQAVAEIKATVQAMPHDLLEEFAAAITAARRKAAA